MKKHITKKVLLLLIFQFVLIGCSKDDNVPQKEEEPDNNQTEIPKWNKTKTTSVYFFSNFSDTSIKESNYTEISDYLKDKKFQAAILDRSDVNLNKTFNGGVKVTNDLKKYSVFNLLCFGNNVLKGSTIIINNLVKEQKSYLTMNTSITTVDASFKNNITIPLAISTFSDPNQVSKLDNKINTIVSGNKVFVVKVKKELLQKIQNKVKSISSSYRVEKIDIQKDYNLVIISPKYWLLRQATKVKTFSTNLVCYHLQIEANVFY